MKWNIYSLILFGIVETNKFHSLKYKCVYDSRFKNMDKNEEIVLSITPEYMKLKSQFYGISANITNQEGIVLDLVKW